MLSPDVLDQVLPKLIRHGQEQYPHEAVGFICPDNSIVFLTNEAKAEGQYEVSPEQIAALFESSGWVWNLEELVIYHTHPSGFVGPSQGDLRARREPIVEHMAHMVISLPNGEACYY